MEKPDVDQIDGLSPAISIDQKGASPQPALDGRDRHRDLRPPPAAVRPDRPSRTARTAIRSSARRVQQIVDQVLALPEGTRLLVLGPLIKDRKTEGDRVFDGARRQGFVRVRVDGEMYDLAEAPTLDKYKRHSDRGRRRPLHRPPRRGARGREARRRRPADRPGDRARRSPDPDASRLADSIETALRLGEGVVLIAPAAARRRAARRSRSAATASATPARTTGSRSTSSSRGASRSTRRTAPARPAPASGRGSRSTRTS